MGTYDLQQLENLSLQKPQFSQLLTLTMMQQNYYRFPEANYEQVMIWAKIKKSNVELSLSSLRLLFSIGKIFIMHKHNEILCKPVFKGEKNKHNFK